MKRFLFPLLALSLCPSAQAAPVHLTCTETKILQDTHVIDTAGDVTHEPANLKDFQTSRVFINPGQNTAQINGSTYSLMIDPSEYVLSYSTAGSTPVSDNHVQVKSFKINRSTLRFEKYSSSLWFKKLIVGNYDLGRQKSEARRKSVGQCRITPAPSGNKI